MKKLFRFKRFVSMLLLFMLLSTLFTGVAGGEPPPVPAAPTDLTATADTSSQISLTWTYDSGNEDGFRVDRKTGGGSFTEIIVLVPGSTSFTDVDLETATTYTYRVQAFIAEIDSAYSNEASATTLANVPTAPTGLTATAVNSSRIDLVWDDTSDNEIGFKIERKIGNGTFEQLTNVAASATTYSNTGLSPGTTYTFRIRAYNSGGDSAYSNEASATTAQVIPAAPTGLAYTYVSAGEIRLTWTDNSNNETGFRIERRTGSSNFSHAGTVGANVTSFTNTGLSNNTQYTYRVYATNAVGDSNQSSNQIVVRTGVPAAPTSLAATRASSSQINLTWTDNANNETGFRIERKTGTGKYAQIATVGINVTSFSNTGLTGNTQYTYRVRAHNAAGNSAYSNEATSSTGIVPNRPTNLVATTVSTSRIDLTWTDNSNNESGFKIERKTGTGSFSQIATVNANVTSFSNTGLTNNREYTYRVRAYNAAGDSAYSNEASSLTGTLPAVPANLKAEALAHDRIRITWEDKSNNETGFRIERKRGTGSYSQIATVGANVTTYTNTGLEMSTEYTYRVRAYNAVGNSAYSNESKTTTKGIPTTPTNLVATPLSGERIVLTWTDRSDDESGFRIEHKRGTGSYTQIATVTANTTTYTDTGLTPETRYTYRIRAYNSYGNSAYSNEGITTTRQQTRIQMKLRVGEPSYQVDGRTLVMDTSPIIVGNRTLLPIRYVADALGATVEWNEREQKVTITLEDKSIELWINSNSARVNGVYRPIDPDNNKVTPIIVPPGRTMMPLRFIAETLGCRVDWIDQTREINITYPAP